MRPVARFLAVAGRCVWGPVVSQSLRHYRVPAVLKSEYVRPQTPRGIRARGATSALSAEMARQLQHAQLHQRVGFRRHAAGGRRAPGNWNARSARSAKGCDGRLVSAQGLPGERCEAGADIDVENQLPVASGQLPVKPVPASLSLATGRWQLIFLG